VILDYQGIDLVSAHYELPSTPGTWTDAFYDTYLSPHLGSALRIYLTDKIPAGTTVLLRVYYSTNENSIAINWLNPGQTSSKTLSYMFTECEDIYCRSVAPMQDTPSVKMPYNAEVTVVNTGYTVRMSANSTGEKVSDDKKWKTFYFKQNLPVPSYLIAFSIGNITERPIGKRTFVITEPTEIDRDLNELSQLEDLLDDVEAYVNPPNPYEWGTYALIV
jgi:leukotriene-A4 hydrolase